MRELSGGGLLYKNPETIGSLSSRPWCRFERVALASALRDRP